MEKSVQVTPGDIEVFRWLWMLRVLTLDQIRRLRYYQPETGQLSSLDNVRKRLRRLALAGYLTGDLLQTTKQRFYVLAEKALDPLRGEYGIDQRRLYKPRSSETLLQLQHPLMVSECAVRFVEATREAAVGIPELAPLDVPFLHTHAVGNPSRRKHVERFVTQEDLEVPSLLEVLRIRPDLVFALSQEAGSRLFFLEADRGFESHSEIGQKLLAYAHYVQTSDSRNPDQRLWQRYGDFASFRVLLVTTSPRRIANLQRTLRDKPGLTLTAMTTAEELSARDPVFEPIWRTASGKLRPLIETASES